MKFLSFKRSNIIELIILIQIFIILLYLFGNVAKIGEQGVGQSLIVIYFLCGIMLALLKYSDIKVKFNVSLLIFIAGLIWISIRYLIDYQEYLSLREIMLGTTGGILLFFLLGLLINNSSGEVKNYYFAKFYAISIMYFGLVVWVYFQLSSQIRVDIFLLDDSTESYQRPGNFISISFIIYSFVYIKSLFCIILIDASNVYKVINNSIYLIITLMLILLTQLIGSNSATAVVLIISFITTCFFSLFLRFDFNKFSRLTVKRVIAKYLIQVLKVVVVLTAVVLLVIFYLEIDIFQMRMFGFGEYENSSINSRFDIIAKWGWQQISFAPIFGDVKVAEKVTGDDGMFLHNFLPSALASLGIIGFILIISFFYYSFKYLFKSANKFNELKSLHGCLKMLGKYYAILIIASLFIFANLTVHYSWCVIWFALGFYCDSFILKKV